MPQNIECRNLEGFVFLDRPISRVFFLDSSYYNMSPEKQKPSRSTNPEEKKTLAVALRPVEAGRPHWEPRDPVEQRQSGDDSGLRGARAGPLEALLTRTLCSGNGRDSINSLPVIMVAVISRPFGAPLQGMFGELTSGGGIKGVKKLIWSFSRSINAVYR